VNGIARAFQTVTLSRPSAAAAFGGPCHHAARGAVRALAQACVL